MRASFGSVACCCQLDKTRSVCLPGAALSLLPGVWCGQGRGRVSAFVVWIRSDQCIDASVCRCRFERRRRAAARGKAVDRSPPPATHGSSGRPASAWSARATESSQTDRKRGRILVAPILFLSDVESEWTTDDRRREGGKMMECAAARARPAACLAGKLPSLGCC